jgi:DNA polymerase I-like protein with 3'-5' exonuclease and polymerase domains
MNIITLDFETYYSQTYSLSKLTTEEYVRGAEFEVIGVAVKVNDGETQWFSGTDADIKKFLEGFSFEDNLALAHNAMFDAAILSWHFGINPRGWLDTLSMARAIHSTEVGGSLDKLTQYYGLGQKGTEVLKALGKRRLDFPADELNAYGGYCVNDVELTYKLFQCMSPEFPASELRLIDLTIRMYSEPTLEFDPELLQAHLKSQQETKAHLLVAVGMDNRDELMSNEKFASLLSQLHVVPPRKISATTGKETWAFSKTDEGFKALADHENPVVQMLVTARLGLKSTQEETRTQRFIDIHTRGKLPIPLRYYAAHTGRWGGDDKINLQNLKRGSLLKKAILAPEGYMVVDSDSSQIEARTVAWLAGQDDLVEAFENGKDVYKIMAAAIYGKEESEITKDERFVGKTTILGAGYGMGAVKFQSQLKTFGVSVEADEAARIIQVYRETYPEIPKLWKQAARALDAISDDKTCDLGRAGAVDVDGKKGIRMPNGLYIKYPNLRKQTNEDGKDEYVYDTKRGRAVIPNRIYGGKVIENLCQGLARTIIGEQMLMIAKKYRVVMTVHDAIAIIAPEAEISTAQKYVEMCMRIRPSWATELPLNCESGTGKSYGDC